MRMQTTLERIEAYFNARWEIIIRTAARESGVQVNDIFVKTLVSMIRDETTRAEQYGVEKLRRVIDPWAVLADGLRLEDDIARATQADRSYEAWMYARGRRAGFAMAYNYIQTVVSAFK